MIRLEAVIHVLQQYAARYRYLDVFAEDIEDLERVPWARQGEALLTQALAQPLWAQALGHGVVRFYLGGAVNGAAAGAPLLGAAIGAALGSTGKKEGAVLAGMGLGMLVGALVAGANPQMNRVMALRYDDLSGTWMVYDGPLLRNAKQALAPG